MDEAHDKVRKITKDLKSYKGILAANPPVDHKRASRMIDHLEAERELLMAKISALRVLFKGMDDVVGLGPDAPVETFYCSSKVAGEREWLVKKLK